MVRDSFDILATIIALIVDVVLVVGLASHSDIIEERVGCYLSVVMRCMHHPAICAGTFYLLKRLVGISTFFLS